MDLEKAGQMAENYFGKIDGWKQWVLSTCWTNDFIETNIEISQTNETVFYFVARNIGITDYVIALFEIPESENDFHEVLKLLNVK